MIEQEASAAEVLDQEISKDASYGEAEAIVGELAVEETDAEERIDTAEEDEESGEVLNLKKLKKAELSAFAEEKEIELPSKATNAEMIEIIEQALGQTGDEE